MTIPSTLDRTLSDVDGHYCAQLFVQFAPYEVRSDHARGWADPDYKNGFVQRVFGVVEEYAPGFRESIVAVDALSPLDLEALFGLHRGSIFHGALALHQLGFARPAVGYASHRSPVGGLYMGSAGTHPGGGVMGACGRNCATVVLEDLARMR